MMRSMVIRNLRKAHGRRGCEDDDDDDEDDDDDDDDEDDDDDDEDDHDDEDDDGVDDASLKPSIALETYAVSSESQASSSHL